MIASSEPGANLPRLPRGALRETIDNLGVPSRQLRIGGERIGRWRPFGPVRLRLLLGQQGRYKASLVVGEVAGQESPIILDVLVVNEPVHMNGPAVGGGLRSSWMQPSGESISGFASCSHRAYRPSVERARSSPAEAACDIGAFNAGQGKETVAELPGGGFGVGARRALWKGAGEGLGVA